MPSLKLSSGSTEVPISSADVLYFTSDGWSNEELAVSASVRYVGALARTFARLRVGVDYGDRAPGGGGFTDWLIQKFWDEHDVRVVNEQPGVMVYETEPPPVFGSSSGAIALAVHAEHFDAIFSAALKDPEPLSTSERVSLALYSAAFFEQSQDARFMLNMMALEALIAPADRPADVQQHLDYLIELTGSAAALPQPERDSLCTALGALKRQSIGQAGRAYIAQQLDTRQYAGEQAIAFFKRCYSIRSRLVHGDCQLPTRSEVSHAAANLEVMMSDLLSGKLRDIPLSAASG
jgi:hypothetical protein